MKKEKILVTGGSGFLGTNFLIKINKNKYIIKSTYLSKKSFFRVPNVKYFKINLENKRNCYKMCKGIEKVVMFAANSSGAGVMQNNPLIHFNPNIIMNINMLEAAYFSGVKQFIFISSNTVYPESENKMREEDVNNIFFEKYFIVAWMKRFTEIACSIYSKKLNNRMRTIVIRPGNIYGPHDKFDNKTSKVIPALIKKILSKKNPLEVWGDGNDIKDFLYVDDFVNGLLKVISKCKKDHEVINIASGKKITIKRIIKIIFNILKYKLDIFYDKSKPSMIPIRSINIRKSIREYNFFAEVEIREGLKKTIDWYFKKNNFKK